MRNAGMLGATSWDTVRTPSEKVLSVKERRAEAQGITINHNTVGLGFF